MRKRAEWEKQVELQKRQEKELRIKREFERRMNPKTKEDFDLLYAALESVYSDKPVHTVNHCLHKSHLIPQLSMFVMI